MSNEYRRGRDGQAKILDAAQLTQLLAELPQPHRAIAAICYYTTSRVGEVLLLQAGDIRDGAITFRRANTKAKKTKTVSVPLKLQAELERAELPQSGYLFPGKNGAITRQAFDKALALASACIGLSNVSSHSFRRTSITTMHRNGTDLKTIQQRSGHASIANVGLYIEAIDGAADAAAELL